MRGIQEVHCMCKQSLGLQHTNFYLQSKITMIMKTYTILEEVKGQPRLVIWVQYQHQ